ncbi:MAG: hypothetical protein KC964_02675, partial [Candidatus Omnitrophica bacterium]|nr:hypothetical protein [Candidatus Omnitrophota bacterium]
KNNYVSFFGNKNETGDYSFLRDFPHGSVEILQLEGRQVDDEAMAEISRFRSLKKLVLRNTRITSRGMQHIGNLSNLEHLDLSRTNIRDEGAAHLEELKNLRHLNLDYTGVTERGLTHLAGLTELEELRLKDNRIGGLGFSALSHLTNLKELHMARCKLSDNDLVHLEGLSSLVELNLAFTQVSDQGLVHLSELNSLKNLDLRDTDVTEAGLEILKPLPSLLFVGTTNLGEQGVMDLMSEGGILPMKEHESSAPKVGIILSLASATQSPGQENPACYGNTLMRCSYLLSRNPNLYAILDPGTRGVGQLHAFLKRFGLADRTIDGSNLEELAQLDVIWSAYNPNVPDVVAKAIVESVRGGVGFMNTNGPLNAGKDETKIILNSLYGIEETDYTFKPQSEVPCTVINPHPILGDLQRGDVFRIKVPTGVHGHVDGTVLLRAPSGFDPYFAPLFTRTFGEGRVVVCQWRGDSSPTDTIKYGDFLIRCLNWAAKRPVDEKWISGN